MAGKNISQSRSENKQGNILKLAIIIIVVGVILYLLKSFFSHNTISQSSPPVLQVSATPDINKPTMYQSNGMSFLIPVGFRVDDKTYSPDLVVENKLGQISFHSQATDADSIDGY